MEPGSIRIVEEPTDRLAEHARIPIAFTVTSVVDTSTLEPGARAFREIPVAPYTKDYDAGEDPASWPERFDLSRWGLIAAFDGARRVGGVVLAFDTPGVDMLEGRRDLVVVWDARVEPGSRRGGVGTALFEAAEGWARARGCVTMKVETQNVNVPACRFYARMGFVVRAIVPDAYPDLPGEVQLLWYKDLAG